MPKMQVHLYLLLSLGTTWSTAEYFLAGTMLVKVVVGNCIRFRSFVGQGTIYNRAYDVTI